jgi:hypothetical protein
VAPTLKSQIFGLLFVRSGSRSFFHCDRFFCLSKTEMTDASQLPRQHSIPTRPSVQASAQGPLFVARNSPTPKIITRPEIGPRFLLGKCRAPEKLCLHYVVGLNESEMIALFQNCSNLRSISLRLMPLRCGTSFRTPLTDDSLKALSLCCPMLEVVELTFTF